MVTQLSTLIVKCRYNDQFLLMMQMAKLEFGSVNLSCLVSKVRVRACGVLMQRVLSWHTLNPSVKINHPLNTTVYLIIVADHVHLILVTIY